MWLALGGFGGLSIVLGGFGPSPSLGPPDVLPDFEAAYTVGAATPLANQYLRLWLPDSGTFTEPVGGWPVLLMTEFGDYIVNMPDSTIPVSGTLEYRALTELGIAVAQMGNTGPWLGFGVRNPFSIGGGLFHPPGTTGYLDDLRYSAPKESVLAVQLLKHNAIAWSLDPEKIIVKGNSTGAGAMGAPASWPNQADASKSDHRQQSSYVLGAMLGVGQYDWGLYDPDIAPPDNFNFFPDATGDQVFDLAPTYGDADPTYIDWASVLAMIGNSPRARARSGRSTAMFLHMGFAGETVTDMTLSGAYTQTEAKRPTANGSLDANASEAKHETAQAILLRRQLEALDFGGYHELNSRLILDQDAYDFVAANDMAALDLVDHIETLSTEGLSLIDLELDWLGHMFALDIADDGLSVLASPTQTTVIAGGSQPQLTSGAKPSTILSGASQ